MSFPLRRTSSLRGTRRLAREKVLQVFAAAAVTQASWRTVFDHIFYRDFTVDIPDLDHPLLTPEEVQELEADTPIQWDAEEITFAQKLLDAAEQYRELSTQILRQVLQNWDIQRLVPVDRLILQLGIAEMLAFSQTPVPVVIDEAVELAKKYSTEHSGQFVNGVLEAAYHWMVQNGLRPESPDIRPRPVEEVLRSLPFVDSYSIGGLYTPPGDGSPQGGED
ncbi:MAG: transcription antitermination factor NusB [Candidatus Kapabacteria bacterium]|nr:transcription antitermination factor NusB [Candidatus Kapabacteria bacterium]MDW7997808.1 transcription antitermination factor NusB [Bacteroidota bacterium]